MPCDTQLIKGETIKTRADDIRAAVKALSDALVSGRVKAVVGPTGAVAFAGFEGEQSRRRITDACLYRRVMASGSAMARLTVERQVLASGRTVDRASLAAGHHSHDGGRTWHDHK